MEANSKTEAGSKTEAASRLSLSQRGFALLGAAVLSVPGTVAVLVAGGALLGGGVYGTTQLQQEFDPTWFLPPTSYLRQWFEANDQFFPSDGER